MAREAQRETLWWVYARVQAARQRRSLLRGSAIGWTSSGYGELLPVEVARPGRGHATVLMHCTAVSPGTERARYLRLPNASRGLSMPGYSGAGVVIATGGGVDDLRTGERVAVAGARHASIATAERREIYRIPDGVALPAAALVYLGVIVGQGLTAADLEPDQPFAVVGAGPIGVLAQRLGAARGAQPVAMVARSRRREAAARAGGHPTRFLAVGEDEDAIRGLGAAVVLEATGDPDAVNVAVAAAAPGGRVVLLGSPRGTTSNLPIDDIRRKRLELVGAHVDTLAMRRTATGVDGERIEGERFVSALADGRLSVDDLIGEPIDPREAGLFYRRLARDDVRAAHFDWTRLAREERIGRGSLLAPPRMRVRGLDYERRPLRLSGAASHLGEGVGDPFAGARGRLRIGLLGCGDIGVDNATAAAAAPNTELAACYDPVERLAREVAAAHDAQVARAPDELFSNPRVDAVLLAVPHHLHAPLALEAARCGKHVIVEKPMANTVAAAEEIAAAVKRSGVALSVCFPMRYEPRVVIARRLVDAGALGRFTGSHARILMDKSPAYWVGGYSGRAISDWRASREKAGGGILMMNVSHYVDLVRHLVGVEVEQVSAFGTAADEPADVEDSISVSLEYANGAAGSVVGASAVRGMASEELRLWGRDGHLAIDPSARVYTMRGIPGVRTTRWQTFGPVIGSAWIRAVYLSRLATSLDAGRAPDVTAEDGLAVQAIIEAAYRSSAEQRAIRPADVLAPESALDSATA